VVAEAEIDPAARLILEAFGVFVGQLKAVELALHISDAGHFGGGSRCRIIVV
jgi:hypothetical protein